jgi:hypothetical protein
MKQSCFRCPATVYLLPSTHIMNAYQQRLLFFVATGLLGLCGSSCPQFVRQPEPRVLPPSPTLAQVIQAVNQNNGRIYAYSTNQASLSGPGMPTLRASINYQRPLLFRLRADTALTGTELDLGSNSDAFWFWMRRNQPPAMYFARHDQFAVSRARQTLPLDPYWIIDALGTSQLDPALPHQGPLPLPGDRLEIRTITETPEGATTKVTVVDAARAVIVEQRYYDAQGRMRASSLAAGHRRDPLTGLYMPAKVTIMFPPAQLTMTIDLGPVLVNRTMGNPAELWAMPNYPGSPLVDLCDPRTVAPTIGARPTGWRR